MRLVVLTYRLTKIKGMLVSVGICALTNATFFMGFASGGAAVALAFSSAAQAQTTPGCNAANGDGTIVTSSGAMLWTSPATCAVAVGATVAMTNDTALAATGGLAHISLTNNGYLHSTLTGTALTGATIAGFSNVVNVGTLVNVVGATITGDYLAGTIALGSSALRSPAPQSHVVNTGTLLRPLISGSTGLAGPGNSFAIYGVNNQLNGGISSFENDGTIQATIASGINPDTVSLGFLVAVNNDGSIGTLNNSGVISAYLSGGVSATNNLTIVGIASTGQIGTLTNSGIISGSVGMVNSGSVGRITNTGTIEGTYSGITTAQGSSIGLLNNSGQIFSTSTQQGAMILLGSISTLQNSGSIGTAGGEGSSPLAILNFGTIDNLNNNSGTIAGVQTGIVNVGGTIASLTNSGTVSGGGAGIANVFGSYDSSIGSYGSIGTLINSGSISGGYVGIYNDGTIATLTNTVSGSITGGNTGINSQGSIGTLTNTGVISGSQVGLANTGGEGGGLISQLLNTGTINSAGTGIFNTGSIGTLTNGGVISGGDVGLTNTGGEGGPNLISELINNGTISGGSTGISNVGTIGAVVNTGLITGGSRGIANYGEIDSLANNGTISGGSVGIYSSGSIGTLTNNGVIGNGGIGLTNTGDGLISELINNGTITGSGSGIYNTATIGTLANAGLITGGSRGIANYGEIDSLTNSGMIQGTGTISVGIDNEGSIGTLWNQINGTVMGVITGSATGLLNGGTITTLTNDGVISAGSFGIRNNDTVVALTNSGVIGGYYGLANDVFIGTLLNTGSGVINGAYALDNYGLISTLTNDGSILAEYTGIYNSGAATIGSLSNTGVISAEYAITNYGLISTLTNSGSIGGSQDGIYNGNSSIIGVGTIGFLSNTGTITAVDTLENYGVISTLSNVGKIIASDSGIYNADRATIGSLTNSGTISGGYTGVDNDGSIGTLANSGTIIAGVTGVFSAGSIGTFSNTGLISGGAVVSGTIENTYGIYNEGSIGNLYNDGSIGGGTVGGTFTSFGIYASSSSVITVLDNDRLGTISGDTAIYNAGTIGTLENSGVILGISAGIDNSGTVASLLNVGATGEISGDVALVNESLGRITSLSNSGTISGITAGVINEGTIASLINSGHITGGYTGIRNSGLITSLVNQGMISGTGHDGIANFEAASIVSLTNSGTIADGGNTSAGVWNAGGIGTLSNSGRISGVSAGVFNTNAGTIGTLAITGGTIQGSGTLGDGIYNAGSITSVLNSGVATGVNVGVYNFASTLAPTLAPDLQPQEPERPADIATLTNYSTGTISGGATGIFNAGQIGALINAGSITGGLIGLNNSTTGTMTSVANSGTMHGANEGFINSGMLGSLTNSGTIGDDGKAGMQNTGSIGTVTSSGLISGVTGLANLGGSIGGVNNAGTITGTASHGLYNTGTLGTLTNGGLVSGANTGVFNDLSGSITSVTNSGTMRGGVNGLANSGTLGSLSNSGTISGAAKAGVENAGSLGTLTSSGTITGAFGLNNAGGTIAVLDNSGTITATSQDGVYTDSGLGTMTNAGVVSGALHALNIDGAGSLGSLENSGLISGPTAIKVAAGGSLGAVTNSGTIAGNIVNASANELSIAGGSGGVFGTLTGYSGGLTAADIGQITNTTSNVLFSAGNVLLNDHVNVGAGKVTNTATLQVDNPINITGSYLQTAAGTLSLGVAGIANHGELNVSSGAVLDAQGRVVLTGLEGFRFAAGEQFTLIDAGSATYNLGSLTTSADGFHGGYSVTDVAVDGHQDLVVCLTNSIAPNCTGKIAYTLATTSNAVAANNAAGGYTGSNADLNKLANALTALGTTAAANRAGNQLLADPHHDAVALAEQPALDVLDVVTGHADVTRLAANGGQSGVSAGESGAGLATWGEAFGGGAHQSQDGQFSGYGISSEGLVAGGDAAIGESNARLGGVFTYTHADLNEHGDRTGDTMGLNSYGLLGYATFLGTRAYADLTGGVMFDQFNTVRVIDFPGFFGVATGNHDGTQYVAKAEAGYRLPMSEPSTTTLTPLLGLAYSHLNQDGYTESGGNGAALRVDGDGSNSLRGEAGLKLEHSFRVTRGDVVPELKVMYRHEFDSGSQQQTAGFAADPAGTTFSTEDVRPVLNTGVASIGVNLLGSDGLTVSLKYGAEIGSGYVSQGGSLRVRWTF
jgi:uncharacterized protein with beta-barrel porin domain